MLRSWSRFRYVFEVVPIGPYYSISSAVIVGFLIVRASAIYEQWPILRGLDFNTTLISLLATMSSALVWLFVRALAAFLMPSTIRDNKSQQEFLEKEEKICSDKSMWAERCADLTVDWNDADKMGFASTTVVAGGFLIWLALSLVGVALFGASLFGFDLYHILQ